MIKKLRQWLYEPRVRGVDVDANSLLDTHIAILREKALLRSAFETFYRDMSELCDGFFPVSGIELELGTGAGIQLEHAARAFQRHPGRRTRRIEHDAKWP